MIPITFRYSGQNGKHPTGRSRIVICNVLLVSMLRIIMHFYFGFLFWMVIVLQCSMFNNVATREKIPLQSEEHPRIWVQN